MKSPSLDRLWETFIKIGGVAEFADGRHLGILRDDVAPLVRRLLELELVEYYSFLVHGRGNVPAPDGDTDAFVHLRLGLTAEADPSALLAEMPGYCLWTRQADSVAPKSISGLDTGKLATGIEEAWRILGEQSEWLLRALAIHDPAVPPRELLPQIEQFLHFFDNMTCRQQEWSWFVNGFMSSTVEENGERMRVDRNDEEIRRVLEAHYRQMRGG